MMDYITNSGMSGVTQTSILRLQGRLSKDQGELSSGRVADVGVALGSRQGDSVSLRQTLDALDAFANSNAVVVTRLEATQSALASIASTGSGLSSTLIAAQSTGTSAAVLQQNARQALAGITEVLNSSTAGGYLFAGESSSTKPVRAFNTTPPSTAQQALATAFQSAFGVALGSANADAITPEQMQQFLDNQFAAEFSDANWKANWSAADDHTLQAQISVGQVVSSSVTANDPSFRKLAAAFGMLSGLGLEALNANTRRTLVDNATRTLQAGLVGISNMQSSVGLIQQTVTESRARTEREAELLTNRVSDLESVDPTKLSIEINNLKTQLETTFSLTAQLQNLNLVKYL
jgi:flagellar hook-associated protein 3 FlgL